LSSREKLTGLNSSFTHLQGPKNDYKSRFQGLEDDNHLKEVFAKFWPMFVFFFCANNAENEVEKY
jgi:hypothetical protein